MPPPGYEPFLGVICENPDEVVVRLAYADWLEENGDPDRAEFIRVQCRLAALGQGPMYPPAPGSNLPPPLKWANTEVAALTRRQAELWAENGADWLAELPTLPGCVVLFHRGFASSVEVEQNPAGLVRNGPRLMEVAPVTRVTFRDCRPEAVEGTVFGRWFGRVQRLTLWWSNQPAGDEVAEVLAGAKHLDGLRDLLLFRAGLTNAGAEQLAAAPFARQLARLDLAINRLTGTGAWAVALALDPDRVTVLDLSGNRIAAQVRAGLRRRFADRVYLGDDTDGVRPRGKESPS
jgi:uncharacterized protein (TIGR02996 family)